MSAPTAHARLAWLTRFCFAWTWLACQGGAPLAGPAAEGVVETRWPSPHAAPWPEADALFRRDPRWRGGDAAISIDLDGDRTLWLFGDSFVAVGDGAPSRARSVMVRNTIALQRGLDPRTAEIAFHWKTGNDGTPGSFFPEQGDVWLWPAHGIRLGRALTIFLHRMARDGEGAFGFRADGWVAVCIDDADADPSSWAPRALVVPETRAYGVLGAAVIAEGDHVYAFGVREPGDQSIWLVRWTRSDFEAGDLGRPAYWRGASGYGPGPPEIVLDHGATELSVSAHASAGGYVEVQSHGFGVGALALRFARALHGPWSAPDEAFRPPESSQPGVFCYAGKAHPELEGADLVATYACNTADFAALTANEAIYYPRFVRVELE